MSLDISEGRLNVGTGAFRVKFESALRISALASRIDNFKCFLPPGHNRTQADFSSFNLRFHEAWKVEISRKQKRMWFKCKLLLALAAFHEMGRAPVGASISTNATKFLNSSYSSPWYLVLQLPQYVLLKHFQIHWFRQILVKLEA